jgi:hypothetical protein
VLWRYLSATVFIAPHHDFAAHTQIGLGENFVIKVERIALSNVVQTAQMWPIPMRARTNSTQPKVMATHFDHHLDRH